MTTRITRSEMKTIVKECLVEILQEGLMGNLNESSRRPSQPPRKINNSNPVLQRPRSSALDTPLGQKDSMKNIIKAEARGNSLMEDIFLDTAENTLPSMMSEGGRKNISLQEQFKGDPEQIFGSDAASKWALLAFSEPKNKMMT